MQAGTDKELLTPEIFSIIIKILGYQVHTILHCLIYFLEALCHSR